MEYRNIELVLDMREVSQHPTGAVYNDIDAMDIIEGYENAGGRIVLVNHPHSSNGAIEDLEYITSNYHGKALLGAHFRLDYKTGYNDDEMFDRALRLDGLHWISVFLDTSPESINRHKGMSWNKVIDNTQDIIKRIIGHEKTPRITTEHAIRTFLSGDEESYNRGIGIVTAASDAGARWYNLPDTTGINDPYDKTRSITRTVDVVAESLSSHNISDYIINVHAHNDINTAEEGVMHAIMNSNARAADLTLGGLGERNGIGDLYTIAYRLTKAGIIDYYDMEALRKLREHSNIILGIENPNQTVDGKYTKSVVAGTHFSAMYNKNNEEWNYKPYYNPHIESMPMGEQDVNVIFTHQSSTKMYEYL
ncbi:MAG: hypothetical protein ACMXYL_03690, partial [Candidatus Woesearchaeota archaeon]